MAAVLRGNQLVGEAADSSLFGGNVLADRGDITGPGSYQEAAEAMNVTGLRYPGGSLTEYTFDMANPDASVVIDERTGDEKSFIPLSDFMSYAEQAGQSVTIVIPTRKALTEEVDSNGDRYEDIDEDVLREYIHDLASGVYGGAQISAIEIGNEYWGSGEMTATEYGRVASKMGKIISDELDLVSQTYDTDTSQIDVVFQVGQNYSYSSFSEQYDGWQSRDVMQDFQERYPDADIDARFFGNSGYINFAGLNNELIKTQFDPEEIEAVDGIAGHVYSRGENSPGSRTWDLRLIDNNWLNDEEFENLKIYVTEWNQKSTNGLNSDTDYGLYQAHEMLNIVEEFMVYGVDVAHVWPLIQNTKNPLSSGAEFEEPAVPGEMFSMMSQVLPGKTMIDFATESSQTEFEGSGFDVHGFAGGDDLVLYVASTSRGDDVVADIDISRLVSDFSSIEATLLGVEEGELPGGKRAVASVKDVDQEDVYEDGYLSAVLEPGEIMQIVIKGIVPADEFSETFGIANGDIEVPPVLDTNPDPDRDEGGDDLQDPSVPETPVIPERPPLPDFGDDEDAQEQDDGGFDILSSLGWAALGFIPLISIFSMA